jgi:hypothetical protein
MSSNRRFKFSLELSTSASGSPLIARPGTVVGNSTQTSIGHSPKYLLKKFDPPFERYRIAKYWRDDPLWKMNGAGASKEGYLFVHHDKYLHGDDGKYHEDFCLFVNSSSGFSQSGFVFFYHRGPEPQKGSSVVRHK